MPPKKVTSAKKSAPAPHTSYRAEGTQCRQAIKKYVQSNNKLNVSSLSTFDAQFNKAIKSGVEKEEFTQPKGPSGPLKLFKKEAPVKAAAKPAAKPATKPAAKTASKPAAAKKAAPKKAVAKTTAKSTAAAAKKAAPKKPVGRPPGKTASKPKANSGKVRKTTTAAPAIVEQPKILSKTKSGRVIKTTAPPPKAARAAPKKRTIKK
ncbi:unnamed protein product [Penicillium salamii]|uniref:Histone H1 n=1 Tax=Penicillium salamii TaxID=1612424 RepID=A0A9W4NC21_9EURO|nr:unnamed protein product [Penicillium salamii]CAG8261532.1 unnamed protein product [Penicillium salamii]CAG8329560.1 unnamed protein product [Penicillium salamii]